MTFRLIEPYFVRGWPSNYLSGLQYSVLRRYIPFILWLLICISSYPESLHCQADSLVYHQGSTSANDTYDLVLEEIHDDASDPIHEVDLYNSLSILHDKNGSLTIAETKNNPQWFSPNAATTQYKATEIYWTRMTLSRSLYRDGKVLHLSSNNWDRSWQHIDVWITAKSELDIHYQLGDAIAKSKKPLNSILNVVDLSEAIGDSVTIICRLEGVHKNRVPERISYFLLDSDFYPGYLGNYPFKGKFGPISSPGAFGANPMTDYEIVELENEKYSLEYISKNWNSLTTTPLFDVCHNAKLTYWIKVKLHGSMYLNGKQLFHISSEPGNDQFSFDYVDSYVTKDDVHFIHQQTGDKVALKNRPLEFWANFIAVDLTPTDSLTVYIHMQGADSRYLMPDMTLYHVDGSSLFPKQSKEAWHHGIFTGILGIQCIFFLLLSLVGRERIYLFFSIMTLGFFLALSFDDNMYSRFVAFPELRDLHIPLFYLGLFLSQVGFFHASRIYFNYETKKSKRYINIYLLISFFIFIYANTQLQFTSGISGYSNYPHLLVALSVILGICAVIIFAIRAKKSKESSKILFLSAFVPLAVAVFMGLSRPILTNVLGQDLFENQTGWANNQDFVKMTIVFMVTLLAVSIGRRTTKLKADKETALKFVEKNKIIEAKSRQNEILLKEIHHRVKNNLQILSSLLSLQSDSLEDENAIDALTESRNRVESMGLIHQRLYTNDDISSVNLQDYISELCRYLEGSFSSQDRRFEIKEDVQYESIDVDYAIPLGLIINELVTNSIKYAFSDNSDGELKLSLSESEQGLELIVSDNGHLHNISNTDQIKESFGSNLIRTLSKKMKGEITLDTSNGYKTKILFKRYTSSTKG